MNHRIAVLALAAFALLAGAPAGAEELPYRISDVITGSLVPQDIIRSATPFDGRYGDLTPQQKAALADDYENLPAGDEPPYPLYGLRHMIKSVVRYADTAGPVGPLVAGVVVDSQGRAGEVTVYRAPDAETARIIAAALSLEPYKPAVCHGQPCKMTYLLRLDFPKRGGQPVTTSSFSRYDPTSHSITGSH
ncbi:hypothetical protein [Scleromatobacter humisilvae]|uniref:TonB C-terminal domain-containing protein n=1 Tax=Scleromatobacter humisilvae TaxID=2897159 RepID=A0A9X1YIG2_9BURK|nr:hypothetical protein [Scleromatobacter humisilvae]MCK9687099.1 hypothetical protein [Scleromatobacter humisilvae]